MWDMVATPDALEFLTSAGRYLSHRSNGDLFHVGWDDDAPMPNSRTRVSGPALDGIDWWPSP